MFQIHLMLLLIDNRTSVIQKINVKEIMSKLTMTSISIS